MPHPLAGQRAPASLLVDVDDLERRYYAGHPDPANPAERVSFGTSGHRGTPLDGSFTEAHILAIAQAICEYRAGAGHRRAAVHGQGHARRLAPGAAHGARSPGRQRRRPSSSSATTASRRRRSISRAILAYNRGRASRSGRRHRHHAVAQSAGRRRLQVQPDRTAAPPTPTSRAWMQDRANELLAAGNAGVRARAATSAARRGRRRTQHDFVDALRRRPGDVIDMEAIRAAGVRIGVDPLGGASLALLAADRRALRPRPHRRQPDASIPTFGFMTVDHDGKIRMDCSSPYAMAGLVGAQGPLRRRLGQRSRRRPPRHRHAVGRADESEPLPRRRDPLPAHAPAGWPDAAASARRWCRAALIDRVVGEPGPRRCSRCRSASNGSRRACSTARSASAARRAPGRASCVATARVWTTDKDGLDPRPARGGDHGRHRQGSRASTTRS